MSSAATTQPAWRRSTLAIGLVGSLLMWASLPPLALGWLGWIAPTPWLVLIGMSELPGRRPYRALYVAGLVFWLLAIHFLRLPHPLTSIGWIALSAYLAIYLPAFVGLSRIAMFRLALPLWVAAPVVWTGLELAKAHLLTGFLSASLAHTQVNWTELIQISDLVGEYGVDFVMMLVAACVTEVMQIAFRKICTGPSFEIVHPPSMVPIGGRPQKSVLNRCIQAAVPAVVLLAVTLLYGHLRISSVLATLKQEGPRVVGSIQGNSLADWKSDPSREREIMDEYIRLSREAATFRKSKDDARSVDLTVWPETMYRNPFRDFDTGYKLPANPPNTTDEIAAEDRRQLASLAAHLSSPILIGIDRYHFVADSNSASERPTVQRFNSAVLVERDGKIVGTYDKIHRVMFGEYIPFADWFPFIYGMTPLTGGIVAGTEPAALRTSSGYCFAPNICYETTIPHVIRRQVAVLNSRGEHPDALVNLTNDAWYWGSSALDMHLACDVFRAVETRVPLVVAANGGISASIDCVGRVRSRLGKQESNFLVVDVEPCVAASWYVRFGDWFAGLCLAGCIFFAIVEWRNRRALHYRTVARPAD